VYEEHYSFRDGGGIWSGGVEKEELERVNIERFNPSFLPLKSE
jgi:hypothetical protein